MDATKPPPLKAPYPFSISQHDKPLQEATSELPTMVTAPRIEAKVAPPKEQPEPSSELPPGPCDHIAPVEGRLHMFFSSWQHVTSGRWLIDLIQHGYGLELTSTPPNISPRRHVLYPEHQPLLREEVLMLLLNGDLEPLA
ncbi:hypothetical protein NDU88_009337 [Pleurodeles waltl]|uniref:Uncharacterized protein n=1 Tax=Pleurodeles waltl TaxID=8319 RepID=A0AAV7RZF6_PLEWA|nr:hypothetical protein NDU88_009337 [Pleurodeles waltl]